MAETQKIHQKNKKCQQVNSLNEKKININILKIIIHIRRNETIEKKDTKENKNI